MTRIGSTKANVFQYALCSWGITAFINHHTFIRLQDLVSYCSSPTITPPQAALVALSLHIIFIVTLILRLCQSHLFILTSLILHRQRGGNARAWPGCLAMLTPQAGIVAAVGIQCDEHAEDRARSHIPNVVTVVLGAGYGDEKSGEKGYQGQ